MEQPERVSKIWIVGSGASGKTTLATKLGHLYNLPVFDLDQVAYKNGVGGFGATVEPMSKKLEWARRISLEDRWVVEGIYLDWVAEISKRADRIIWLDLPLYVIVYRAFSRHIRRSLLGNNRYKGIARLLLYSFWLTRYRFHKGNKYADRNATAKVLARYSDKVIHCKRQIYIDQLLAKGVV